jgi:hypothetical protein
MRLGLGDFLIFAIVARVPNSRDFDARRRGIQIAGHIAARRCDLPGLWRPNSLVAAGLGIWRLG